MPPSSSSFASSSLFHVALTFLLLPVSTAFQVDYKTPKQCTPLDLTFSGTANPPFKLLILPFASTAALRFDVPDNSWNTTSNTGTFHTTIPFPSGTKFLMSMDDGMGRGTGGVSSILEMQKSDDASCLNDAQPAPPQVTFEPPAPIQCKPLTTSWSGNFSSQFPQPISIRGFVPGKNAFSLDMAANATKNIWTVDVPAGSQFMLTLHDGDGGILETSPLMTSTDGKDTSCLIKTDAVGGPNAPKANTTPSAVAAAATPEETQATPSNAGTIAGAIIGALVLCGIVGVGAIMFFRKQRNQVSSREEIGDEPKTDFRPISMPPPPLPPKSPSYYQRSFPSSPATPAMTSTPVTATHLLASSTTTLDAEPESPDPSSATMSYDSHHPIITTPSTTPQERRRTLTVPARQEAVRTELHQELPDATIITGRSTNNGKIAGSGNSNGTSHITRSATAFAGSSSTETRLAPVAAITRSASTSAATPSNNNNVVFTSRPPPRMQVPQTPLTPHDHFSGFSNRQSTASTSGGLGFGMNSRPSSSRISRNSDILQFANLADMVSIGNEDDVPAVPALPSNVTPAPIHPSSPTPTRNQYPDEKAVYRRQEAEARARTNVYQGTLPLDLVSRDRQGLGLSLTVPPPSYDSLQ